MVSDRVEAVWLRLKDRVDYDREGFLLRVEDLARELKITQEAAAYIMARELGVDVPEFFVPAKRGRILDVGPVRVSRGSGVEIPYCLFTLVDEEERVLGCAFGDRVNDVKGLEERAVEISRYTMARSTRQKMLRVTEGSEVRPLDEGAVPPMWELRAARAASLKDMSESSWTWIVEAVVVDEDITEYNSCPFCGKGVELGDGRWICGDHGPVDVRVRKVYHLHVADSSGVYPAVYFGEPPGEGLFKKRIVVKGHFREGELQVSKFYMPKVELGRLP